MSEPELSQYRASQRLLNPNSASSNRQYHKKQQSDDAQIAQQLYNAHLSDQGVKKQRPNNTQIVQQKYLSRSSLGMSNNHLNDTINSQRSYSSYVHTQPVLSHSFNYAISMHDFLKRIWIDLPELKSEITDFKLHAQLLKNAEKMEISKLTSCQSILMTLFFAGDRSLDYIVHAPHLSGVTVGVAFCMVDYVMDYKEYDHTFQKSFAPMVIVLCESDSDVYRTYLGFSKVAEKTGVSVYNIQQKPRKPQNVEKRKVCDILIASPVIVTDLINNEEINVSRVRFVFADWADKVFKAFGLQSTTKLIRYLGKENNAVRILGCEHIYESRREFYYESCRESPIELRVERPNDQ